MNSVQKMNYNYFNSLTLSQRTLIYDRRAIIELMHIVDRGCNSNAINIKLDWNVVIMIVGVLCATVFSVQRALFNFTILNIFEFFFLFLSSFRLVRFVVVESFQWPVPVWMNWQKATKKYMDIKVFKMPLELVSLRLVFGVRCILQQLFRWNIWWVCATLTLFVNYSRR